MDEESKQFLTTALSATEERLKSYVNECIRESESRLNQRIEKTETSLLTEFHGWARPN